jgi:hypothetical protein
METRSGKRKLAVPGSEKPKTQKSKRYPVLWQRRSSTGYGSTSRVTVKSIFVNLVKCIPINAIIALVTEYLQPQKARISIQDFMKSHTHMIGEVSPSLAPTHISGLFGQIPVWEDFDLHGQRICLTQAKFQEYVEDFLDLVEESKGQSFKKKENKKRLIFYERIEDYSQFIQAIGNNPSDRLTDLEFSVFRSYRYGYAFLAQQYRDRRHFREGATFRWQNPRFQQPFQEMHPIQFFLYYCSVTIYKPKLGMVAFMSYLLGDLYKHEAATWLDFLAQLLLCAPDIYRNGLSENEFKKLYILALSTACSDGKPDRFTCAFYPALQLYLRRFIHVFNDWDVISL